MIGAKFTAWLSAYCWQDLQSHELKFVEQLLSLSYPATERQIKWLCAIYRRMKAIKRAREMAQ